jgi:hypothetical protein
MGNFEKIYYNFHLGVPLLTSPHFALLHAACRLRIRSLSKAVLALPPFASLTRTLSFALIP